MKYPLVTIIILTYNRAHYVTQTIDSVLKQAYPNLELIVINDGGTDQTEKILKPYRDKIIYYCQKNLGETQSANKYLKIARGEYICILGDDDLFLPGMIKDSVKYLSTHTDVLAVYSDWQAVDAKGNLIDYSPVPTFNYAYMFSHYHCLPNTSATFIRKTVITQYQHFRDKDLKYVADFDYWLRLGLIGKIKHLPGYRSCYRIHQGSQSTRQKGDYLAEENIKLVNKMIKLENFPRKYLKLKNQAFSAAYYHAGGQYKSILKRIKAYLFSFFLSPKIFLTKLRYEFVRLKKKISNP